MEEQGINEIVPVIYQMNETKYYLLTGSSGYPSADYSFPSLLSGYGNSFVILEDRVKTADMSYKTEGGGKSLNEEPQIFRECI